MRLGNYLRTIALAATTTLATSCGRGTLHRIQAPQHMTHTIDSLRIASKNVLKDPCYKAFGVDTLEITEAMQKSPKKFADEINSAAQRKSPEDIVGTYITYIPIRSGKATTILPVVNNIYEDAFKNSKAVIKDGIFANEYNKMYVPVEYYGIPRK